MRISVRGKRGGSGRGKNGGDWPRGVGHARARRGRPTSIFSAASTACARLEVAFAAFAQTTVSMLGAVT
jgi:hypothetical protein